MEYSPGQDKLEALKTFETVNCFSQEIINPVLGFSHPVCKFSTRRFCEVFSNPFPLFFTSSTHSKWTSSGARISSDS